MIFPLPLLALKNYKNKIKSSIVNMMKVVVWLVFAFTGLANSLDLGSTCTTPNGERAKCILVTSCNVIKTALFQRNDTAIKFARLSQCGYLTGQGPLVCCGSTAFFETRFDNSNSNNKNSLLPNGDSCGYEEESDRVYGGEIAQIGEHPWIALLGYINDGGSSIGFKCGGTLINKRYVLTAAHCVVVASGLNLDNVRLGEWRISTEDDCADPKLANPLCADPVIDVKIEKTIVHPQYQTSTASNDIALLRLARNIEYSGYVRPICLPAPNAESPPVGANLTVAGWGATETSSYSDYKLKVNVPVVDHKACALKMRRRRPINQNQLCAGGIKDKDSCQGDSGGPLMGALDNNRNNKKQWYQEGVVSWGVGCGHPGFPGVYTQVSKYVTWISDNIEQ